MRFGFAAVGVNVARGERQRGIGGQQPSCLRRKKIRVPANLMNGPTSAGSVGARTGTLHNTRICHVVEHKPSAHRLGRARLWDVVDFPNLKRGYVAVFGKARGNHTDVAPLVRSRGGNRHFLGHQHQIRLTDGPLSGFVESKRLRHIRRIAARGSVVHPFDDHRDLVVV